MITLNEPQGLNGMLECMLQVDPTFADYFRRAFAEALGPRCPDFEPECCVCDGWAQLDEVLKRALLDNSLITPNTVVSADTDWPWDLLATLTCQ